MEEESPFRDLRVLMSAVDPFGIEWAARRTVP